MRGRLVVVGLLVVVLTGCGMPGRRLSTGAAPTLPSTPNREAVLEPGPVQIDRNGDGRISRQEFVPGFRDQLVRRLLQANPAYQRVRAELEKRLDAFLGPEFDRLDTNHDGYAYPAELVAWAGQLQARAKELAGQH